MINFINKTVEILAHILYNKGQANQEGLLAFYTIIEQEDKNMSLKDFDYKKGGIFAAGVLFGTAGIKALSSKDAKNLYTKATAGAQQINDERAAAEDAAEAEGQDEAAETVAEEETKTEEKAE